METDGRSMAETQGATPPALARPIALAPAARRDRRLAPELGQAAPAGVAAVGLFPPAAGAAAAGAAARARPRRHDADDRAAAGRGARSDDGQRGRGDEALLPQPGDPVGVPQPAALHLRARRRCWIRSACSRRATRSCTTCCRPFTATRSTTSCCCARTRAASRRWRRRRAQILDGTHPHQRALTSLIEDGAYHARLPRDIAAFQADPHEPARPIPAGLVGEARPDAGDGSVQGRRAGSRATPRACTSAWARAIAAWLAAGFDETLGGLIGRKLGPRRVRLAACDPEILARYALPGEPPR